MIIPTHARPEQLRACLAAMARQDFPASRFEVVVVDDASPVSVEPELRDLRVMFGLTVVRVESNVGPARARNLGACAARGRFLIFLDDDCTPEPDWLSRLWPPLSMPERPAVGGRIVNAVPGNPYARASHFLSYEIYPRHEAADMQITFLSTANLGVPADTFLEIGGFHPGFGLAYEDRDFCDRWHASGGALAYAPDAVVAHHRSMTLRGFLRQHFEYGRSARRYQRNPRRAVWSGDATRLPLFFLRLIGRVHSREGWWETCRFASLLVVSQTAAICGYVKEYVAAAASPGESTSGPAVDEVSERPLEVSSGDHLLDRVDVDEQREHERRARLMGSGSASAYRVTRARGLGSG